MPRLGTAGCLNVFVVRADIMYREARYGVNEVRTPSISTDIEIEMLRYAMTSV